MSAVVRQVLVTDGRDGRGRDVVAAVRGLAVAGYRPIVTVVNPSWRSSPSRYCAGRLPTPPVGDGAYADTIRAELASARYVTVIPASEDALSALGMAAPALLDKSSLHAAAVAAGLRVPESRLFGSRDDLLEVAGQLEYPLVVKPTFRRYWAFRADRPEQLRAGMTAEGPVIVQPFVNHPMSAVSGVIWQGQLVAAVHENWLRIWPPGCGLASAAETVRADPALEQCLVTLLSSHTGLFCAQFVGDSLIDLNLRIHSSHPLAVAAGANLVAIYCDLLRGKTVAPVRGRPGVLYRWLEGDVRHVFAAWRAERLSMREAAAALRPRRGTAHSTESLVDPLPIIDRISAAILRRMGGQH